MAEKSLRTPTFAWTHTSHFGNWATAKPTYEYAIIFTKNFTNMPLFYKSAL